MLIFFIYSTNLDLKCTETQNQDKMKNRAQLLKNIVNRGKVVGKFTKKWNKKNLSTIFLDT